jgi:hypothetical protein
MALFIALSPESMASPMVWAATKLPSLAEKRNMPLTTTRGEGLPVVVVVGSSTMHVEHGGEVHAVAGEQRA